MEQKVTVIFRVDSSFEKGSGHVMRCKTLAKELSEKGVGVLFICNEAKGNINHLIEEDFKIKKIKTNNNLIEGNNATSIWKTKDQIEDANACVNIIRKLRGEIWVLVDNYSLDIAWETTLRRNLEMEEHINYKMMVIDDLANRQHWTDYLLDQNYFGKITKVRYEGLVNRESVKLLGTDYALIRKEFKDIERSKRIVIKKSNINILCFFGGSDPYKLTTRTINALINLNIKNIKVNVIVGTQNQEYNTLREKIKLLDNITLLKQVNTMARVMAQADLAIGSCGSTTWERAFMKLPSAIITFGEDQRQIAGALAEGGYIHLIGDQRTVSNRDIMSSIEHCLTNIEALKSGEELVDGYGCQRISSLIAGIKTNEVKIKKAKKKDMHMLLNWANESEVRKNSKQKKKITEEEHKIWFIKGLRSSKRILLIAKNLEGCPVGQIRFDHDRVTNEVLIDISIDEIFRGKGLAYSILSKGIERVIEEWGLGIELTAYINKNNNKSYKTFEKYGFRLEDNKNQDKYFKYKYSRQKQDL